MVILFSSSAQAHPGKTDRQDGHTCLKNCGEWELYHAEYHLHDKDRNPIRIERKKKSVRQTPSAAKTEVVASAHEDTKAPPSSPPKTGEQEMNKTDQSPQIFNQSYTQGCVLTLYDIILLSAAGLLLLVMLVLRIRKRVIA